MIKKTLALVLFTVIFTTNIFAQEWIYLGELRGISYNINPKTEKNNTHAFGKTIIVNGEYEGYYMISKFEISCREGKGRIIRKELFTPNNESLEVDNSIDAWIQTTTTPKNFMRLAFDYWCEKDEVVSK